MVATLVESTKCSVYVTLRSGGFQKALPGIGNRLISNTHAFLGIFSMAIISQNLSNVTIGDTELPIIEYKGQRVITFALVDKVHQRPEGTAKRT
jgi:hypothetical protein